MSYDRLTDLPEPLRQHILSFLPIKYAVQTSILSSSWRMVWTGLRCLRTLDFSDMYLPSSLTEEGSAFHFRDLALKTKGEAIVRMREDFYNFLDRVFGLVTELEELKLYVPGFGLGLKSRVDHWLDRAVGCGVKYLELKIAKSEDYDFVRVKHTPVDLVNSLLWLAPCLESLRVSNFDDDIVKLFKFTYEKPVKGKKKCGCWKFLAINCWRHSLTNVSLEYELEDEDDTELAEFFCNARIDGKMVDFVKTTAPEMEYGISW